MARKKATTESFLVSVLKEGDTFYTNKSDRNMTALAVHNGVKILTQRCFVVNPDTLVTEQITRVTIIKTEKEV